MVLDSSALLAILLREPGYERLLEALDAAETVSVGAPTLAEAKIVLGARAGFEKTFLLDELLRQMEAEVLPFGREHADEAVRAYRRFGKGRHPAGLNFGDAMSYAMAQPSGEPLLFVGDVFSRTDVQPALS
ncbi:type II toxin-antitoxin system VapC family toxin [Oceanithermus sp.]